MQKLGNNSIGVEQGESVVFSDFQHGGQMWTGEGDRERRKRVTFSEAFRKRPVVHCSLSLWDMDSTANVRADVKAECIDDDGFDIVFRTWGDTRVARARIGWMAIGEVKDPDDWDV
ncbi:H-type lectin domain-containing protein [Pseudooceanicola sp.]|uniref:H-type lectin domain-containing protein n=1 Tax=Pseudooceanicola sp. TaxID=1914328 RepID=UPI0035C71146